MCLIFVKTMYLRFAKLTAAQKAAARALYQETTALETALAESLKITTNITPLVNCYFKPQDDKVSPNGYFEFDPQAQR